MCHVKIRIILNVLAATNHDPFSPVESPRHGKSFRPMAAWQSTESPNGSHLSRHPAGRSAAGF